MKEIIIGRNGTQPFPITADGVSGRHASLTVNDDGSLLLRDLSSKNGTFVYDRAGSRFVRIGSMAVDSSTTVRLGADDTVRSYRFTIGRLLRNDPDDFSEEFREMRHRWHDLSRQKEKSERLATIGAFLPATVSLILLAASFFIPDTMPVNMRMNILRTVLLIPAIIAPAVSLGCRRNTERINTAIKETMICPNPECNKQLSEQEMIKGRCLLCKKHI